MDITILFKACVKTVRTTDKALGAKELKTNILKPTRKDSQLRKARDIVKQITSLQHFLLENKIAYLNVINYLSTNKTMTEFDREQIDSAAQTIINSCTTLINDYKKEVGKNRISKQCEEHYRNIIESIELYLKQVSKIYTEAKAVRVKRVIETHKLSKLETKPTSNSTVRPDTSIKSTPNNKTILDTSDSFTNRSEVISPQQPIVEDVADQLSPEEMQMFESENEHLFNELNSLSDEVKQIESKVVHISELQELFTEKVLQQEKDIERIATNVVNTTDNMKDANEQIRQAIQQNAGLRVWILFFLLVMSFSLLFLDWYND